MIRVVQIHRILTLEAVIDSFDKTESRVRRGSLTENLWIMGSRREIALGGSASETFDVEARSLRLGCYC